MADGETWCAAGPAPDSCSRVARRRRMVLRRTKLTHLPLLPPSVHHHSNFTTASSPDSCGSSKRRRLHLSSCSQAASPSSNTISRPIGLTNSHLDAAASSTKTVDAAKCACSGYGFTSICGRRREMEDTVSIHPAFAAARQYCDRPNQQPSDIISYHFFGVFDGHGCYHVAELCRERMHEIVAEQLNSSRAHIANHMALQGNMPWWKAAMDKCFAQMDEEAIASASNTKTKPSLTLACTCELRLPLCNNVGSTATVAVVGPRHIVVANCGDSRAVLCRNGSAIPLSSDHKPDRPDELQRIQSAGGRVIYWDGARVFGVLAMSRAIGDSYLKPFVISDPEVTVTEITEQDECLILASDGLWDVVSNELACQVVSTCLQAAQSSSSRSSCLAVDDDICMSSSQSENKHGVGGLNRACVDAAMLLTKLALARHTTDNISVIVVDLIKAT